ncbi:hypothetical protein [Candidatus Lokiarchaeum ossiferum]|uniref:hypothetical protein n=1 Tax=Candidatus Lokiarchaeum ossiferum TaxID=2951803 RepID=UPI00352F1790
MSYISERNNIGKIALHLDQINIPYRFQDIGDQEDKIFPALICTFRVENLEFDVIIYNLNKWIHIKTLVMDTADLSSDILLKVYELCLELNYDLPEVTFSAFQKNIFIEVDCLVDVDFDDFKAEFLSIGDGIEAFISTIKQRQNISIQSTKGFVPDKNSKMRRKKIKTF